MKVGQIHQELHNQPEQELEGLESPLVFRINRAAALDTG